MGSEAGEELDCYLGGLYIQLEYSVVLWTNCLWFSGGFEGGTREDVAAL